MTGIKEQLNLTPILIVLCFYPLILFGQSEPKLVLPIGHTNRVFSAQFSPNGKSIVTVSNDKTAKVWDATSGNLIHTLEGNSKMVVSPDGRLIGTASSDGTAKLWDTAIGEFVYTLKGIDEFSNCCIP